MDVANKRNNGMSTHSKTVKVLAGLAVVLVAGACSETKLATHVGKQVVRSETPQGITYKVGNPYQITGVWYYPHEDFAYDEVGIASWYGPGFHGKSTANGEAYDQNALTAAHRTLPLPSLVRVTNLDNGRSVVLRVNDRGPFANDRIIDVSRRAAQLLGFEQKGTARVRVQILGEESLALKNRLQRGQSVQEAYMPPPPEAAPVAPVETASLDPMPPANPMATIEPTPIVPPTVAEPAALPELPAEDPAAQSTEATPAPSIATTQQSSPPTDNWASTVQPPEKAVEPPAPPAQMAEKTTVSVPPKAGFYVQVAHFSRSDYAERSVAALQEFGQPDMTEIVSKGRTLYRVRLGPVSDQAEAMRLLDSVRGNGYPDALLVEAR